MRWAAAWRRHPKAGPGGPVETVLGRGAEFRGELRSSGSVRVDGCLEGFVRTSAELIVGQTGRVVADVEAASVLVAGEL
ncbi:MAG TPA: polymer-forming cytoskeletal protein, partial [Limnochordales bacterium]